MTVSENLEKAADLIAQRGFAQKYLHDSNGCLCVLGAVLTVRGRSTDTDWTDDDENLAEVRALALALYEYYPRFQSVSNWNDKKGRTQEEAIEFLRLASRHTIEWYSND